MTASVANGLAVIADEPTAAPIKTRDGKPIIWKQTRTLLLEDGSTLYGCAHCDYTHDSPNGIRPHLRVHAEPKAPKARREPGDLSLNDLMSRLSDLAKVEADRDKWRQRALTAEKSLATLRKALKEVSG